MTTRVPPPIVAPAQQHYITASGLGVRYGRSERTVWRWVSEGILPKPHKFGGASLFRLEEIEKREAEFAADREAESA